MITPTNCRVADILRTLLYRYSQLARRSSPAFLNSTNFSATMPSFLNWCILYMLRTLPPFCACQFRLFWFHLVSHFYCLVTIYLIVVLIICGNFIPSLLFGEALWLFWPVWRWWSLACVCVTLIPFYSVV